MLCEIKRLYRDDEVPCGPAVSRPEGRLRISGFRVFRLRPVFSVISGSGISPKRPLQFEAPVIIIPQNHLLN